jgi:hypothetical protein
VAITIFDQVTTLAILQLMVDTNDIVEFGVDIRARRTDIAADVTIEALLPQNIVQKPTIDFVTLDY